MELEVTFIESPRELPAGNELTRDSELCGEFLLLCSAPGPTSIGTIAALRHFMATNLKDVRLPFDTVASEIGFAASRGRIGIVELLLDESGHTFTNRELGLFISNIMIKDAHLYPRGLTALGPSQQAVAALLVKRGAKDWFRFPFTQAQIWEFWRSGLVRRSTFGLNNWLYDSWIVNLAGVLCACRTRLYSRTCLPSTLVDRVVAWL